MPERCGRIAGNSEVIHVPDKRAYRKLDLNVRKGD